MCRSGGPKCPKISIKKRIGKLCWNIAGRQVLKRLPIFKHWLFNNQYFLTYQAKSDMANCRRLYPAIVIALSFNCWLTVRILPRRDTCNSPRDDMCPSLVLNTKIRKDYEDFIHTRSEIIHGGSEIIHAGSELNYCCCTTIKNLFIPDPKLFMPDLKFFMLDLKLFMPGPNLIIVV